MKTYTVSAIFDTHTRANQAMEELMKAGFSRDDISLLMSKTTRDHYYPVPETSESATAWGAGVGAMVGALVGITAAVPGGVFVAGPLLGMLSGAAVGGAGGGFLGALIDLGVPAERAKIYKQRIETGGIFVAVATENEERAAEAERIMLDVGESAVEETSRISYRASA